MTALPGWMRPPREEGRRPEDLDHLPDAPRHTELIHGALVFLPWPQTPWHDGLVTGLAAALTTRTPDGIRVEREMPVRLDAHNRPAPDLLLTTASTPSP